MLPSELSYMHRLIDENLPIAEIARRLGRCRQTIYNWIQRQSAGHEPVRRPSKLDPYKPYLESRLCRFDLPATVLLREIREQGYEGGITILREFVAGVKQRHVQRVVDRFETEPGRQAQVDWASCGTIVHEGRRRHLSLLLVVLGYSRVIWARFVVTERRPVMMELLEQAFQELGGVARELLLDNLKQAIEVARTPEAPAKVQTEFQAFADHWGFEVVACPPYWPRAKGKVERAVDYVKRSFLEGRTVVDLADLNAQLRQWLAEVANVRVHGTTQERPIDRLAADQAAFRPCAETAFPSAQRSTRRADHDARISFGGVRYSVDPSILTGRRGEPVDVCVGTDERLRIYHQGRWVGEHAIVPSGSLPQDDPQHAAARRERREPPSWQRPRGQGPRFDQIGGDSMSWEDLAARSPVVHERPLSAYDAAAGGPHAG